MESENARQPFDCNERMEQGDAKFFRRKRYLVATLTFFGSMLLFFIRSNLDIGMIQIMRYQIFTDGEPIYWSPGERVKISCAYGLGFMAAPLGAVGVRKYGGVVTFGAAVGLAGLLSCFTPIIVYWHFSVLLVARLLQGFCQGVCASTFIEVIRLWSIPTERNRLIVGAFSGTAFGFLLSSPLYSYALSYELNWKVIFYVTGGVSLLWCLIWFIYVKNSPEEDQKISAKEKNYIRQRNPDIRNEREVKFAWSVTLKSKPVWAYLNEIFVVYFTTNILIGYLPSFISDTFGDSLLVHSSLLAIQIFCTPVGLIVGSILADDMRNYKKLSSSGVHKLFLSFGQIIVITLMLTIAVFSSGSWANLSFVSVNYASICVIFAINSVAYTVLPVDMGGQYASLIFGFGNTVAGFTQILVSLVLMILTHDSTPIVWFILTVVLSILNFWGAFIFYKFGSGELQPWAVPSESI